MRLWLFAVLVLVAACGDRSQAPVVPDSDTAGRTLTPVFVATNRARNAEGYFDRERQADLTLLSAVVSIPPTHEAGDAPSYSKRPDPDKHFTLASQDAFASRQAFKSRIRDELAKRPREHQEVAIYVHGYFNGYSDSVFRLAQMRRDFQMEGVPIAFSWPSAGKPTGYAYDRDSILYSRDALEELLYLVSETGARNIVLLSHSMGGLLVMETMRQIDRKRPGWSARNLDAVVMMSPDISVDVFRTQAESVEPLPDPFIVIASRKDRILKLSTKVSLERDRLGLGNSVDELADLPILFVDVTDFSEPGTNPHFVAAESPTLIAVLSAPDDLPGYIQSDQNTLLGGVLSSTAHIQNSVVVELSPEEQR